MSPLWLSFFNQVCIFPATLLRFFGENSGTCTNRKTTSSKNVIWTQKSNWTWKTNRKSDSKTPTSRYQTGLRILLTKNFFYDLNSDFLENYISNTQTSNNYNSNTNILKKVRVLLSGTYISLLIIYTLIFCRWPESFFSWI